MQFIKKPIKYKEFENKINNSKFFGYNVSINTKLLIEILLNEYSNISQTLNKPVLDISLVDLIEYYNKTGLEEIGYQCINK